MSTNMDLWSTLDSVMHRLFCDKQEEDSWVGFYQYLVFCQHFQFYMKGTIIKSFLTDHQFYQQFFLQGFPLRAPMFVSQVSWIVWAARAAVSWCVPHQEECAARPSTLSNGQTAHTCFCTTDNLTLSKLEKGTAISGCHRTVYVMSFDRVEL